VTNSALVLGGTIEGVQAALDIANSGIEVILIEKSFSLDNEIQNENIFLRPKFLELASHPNIRIIAGVDVDEITGERGSFRIKGLQHPRYVDTESCVSCGRCELACSVNIVSHEGGRANKAHKAIHMPAERTKSIPSTCIVEKTGVAPCTAACPAGINVQGYVSLISKGKLREALDLIREAIPFPHILGRVCTHPCENACTRGKVDQPIAIATLKRYLADMEPSQYTLIATQVIAPDSPSRVAIIGSGPAGLTCARDLVRMGHNSTVFEALPVAGGMVAVGMPRFRLPREVREAEINAITNLGIEIKTNMPIGKDLTLDDLKQRGYEAIFIASGAHKNATLDIPGEDLEGVIDSIELLRNVNLKRPTDIGKNVVVVGGGYTAIDSARTAIRLHCNNVRILYRRTADEMYATKAELLETIEEGVDMTFLAAPIRIVGENGKVVGIECQEMVLGEPDESGRKSPVPVEGSSFIFECDTVIPAIGQLPDLDIFNHGNIRLDNNGRTLTVNPLTLRTNEEGILAGGDVVSGPRSMVEAVGDGRRAAVTIDRILQGMDLEEGRTLQKPIPVQVDIKEVRIPPGGRRRIPVLPVKNRLNNFEEVEKGYTTFMALREAKRCLACGGCSECMECVRTCDLAAVRHDMKQEEIELEAGAIVVADPLIVDKHPEAGLYVVGSGQHETDVSQRLTEASAIASKVLNDLSGYVDIKRAPVIHFTESIPEAIHATTGESRMGVFICHCGGNISDVLDVPRLARHFFRREGVAYAQEIGYACSDDGALEIRNMALEWGLTHVVVAACACCALDQICFSCSDRRIECKEKLLGYSHEDEIFYEFVNIREHCSWVHRKEPQKAFDKAKALIRGAMARASEGRLEERRSFPIEQSVAVVGDGLSGIQAANDLSLMGIPTTLISWSQKDFSEHKQQLLQKLKQNGAGVLDMVRLQDVQGTIGQYSLKLLGEGNQQTVSAGAIIVDLSVVDKKHLPSIVQASLPSKDEKPESLDMSMSRIPGIFLCGIAKTKTSDDESIVQGSAAAAKVAVLLSKGEVQLSQTTATVDPAVCRGCGTCASICEFGAASLIHQPSGLSISEIDQALCRGCGTCVAHCPSNAIDQNGLSDCQITDSLEAMLTVP
jgi:NADPH-dependent glutamate synthase beta subunit-like oxidoreductase/NAD-dependent dihydropyrimidine dehydrogenase PreA subunit